ncbi:enoyl-CoA hydratase-related protein [Amycolatopsis sp. FDAARGOS 1241]|uniref:enoyl-CoA hydratase-related protein n=1 Tax=Amycolatopsis sp. FDAARGOS 1241 TaxID=2778070 RepID=UPI00194DD6BB|nr:enoyl-CoA hydratase-related protein [Amycolatopsis sp. FDAARGOS 1241]QRP47645.1 enoyl-CoA hydratase/isomerase family protein [Amycolatopsis sp. FDAARGOS 1241]
MSIDVVAGATVTTVTINRPDKRNALTKAMYSALAEVLDTAETPVVVLSGAGGAFTAGNDLGDFLAADSGGGPDTPVRRFQEALLAARSVVVAAVDGPAVGIGATLLLHCDLVYATERSYLQFPFTSLGLVPEFGSSYVLPRLAGPQRAAELLLFGDRVPAAEAHRLGLVNEVLPDAEALEARVADRTAALAAQPPLSLALSRELLRDTTDTTVRDRMEVESQHFAKLLHDPATVANLRAKLGPR